MTVGAALELQGVAELVAAGGVCVLSGAGLSTESGIPDYRGPTGQARPATPMTYQEFLGHAEARRRYWARSHAGWHTFGRAQPNAGHHAVAGLQGAGLISGIITQNVDGLHQAGGARDVLELHGALNRVICLDCRATTSRAELDVRLRAANADTQVPQDETLKPDGDVELAPEQVGAFQLVDCLDCQTGRLKPDVVFFGEFLPPERVSQSYALVTASRVLLVLGSSLTVASGFRFVRRAAYDGIDIVIINQGPTRGDRFARFKIEQPLGEALADLNTLLSMENL